MQLPTISTWQRLKNQEIDCEQALKLLVDEQGTVDQALLDRDVSCRFLRHFPDKTSLAPEIPLLLWRGCYYLGSPVILSTEAIANLAERTGSEIKIISITNKSYRAWFHTQNLNLNRISSVPLVNPLTGEYEQEDIGETIDLHLSKAADQIGRIKTLISGALRNRRQRYPSRTNAGGLKSPLSH